MTGTATERLLLPRNSCLIVTLEEMRNMLGTELNINIIVLYLFVMNHFIQFFSSFHVSDPCI